MKGRKKGLTRIAALAGLCAMATGSAAADTEGNIQLTISGDKQTRFSGECVVTLSDGREETIPFGGSVPLERRLHGSGLSCRLQQDSEHGSLQVEVRKNGNVSRSRTQGKGSVVNLRVK